MCEKKIIKSKMGHHQNMYMYKKHIVEKMSSLYPITKNPTNQHFSIVGEIHKKMEHLQINSHQNVIPEIISITELISNLFTTYLKKKRT